MTPKITMKMVIIVLCYYLLVIQNFSCAILTSSTEPTKKVLCVSNNSCVSKNYDYSEYHVLAYYMNHSSKYFKSHETYVFQPGQHTPANLGTLTFTNITNLTFTGLTDGSSRAVIDCNGKFVAFQFKNLSNITIEHLTFSGCVTEHSTESDPTLSNGLATLTFFGGTHLSLLAVTILGSVDKSFNIMNIFGDVVLRNVVIVNASMARVQRRSAGNRIIYTGCDRKNSKLYITDSMFSNSSVYYNNPKVNFTPHASGLSIKLKCPNITVTIINVTMSNNIGNTGGNLAISFHTFQTQFSSSVDILNSIFEGGQAIHGGGMYVEFFADSSENSKVICPENYQYHKLLYIYNTSFIENAVMYEGSGVYLRQEQSLTLCSREEIIFTNVTFRRNSVLKTGFGGIAIHSINSIVTDLYHRNPQYYVIFNNCYMYDNYAISQKKDSSGTGVIFTKSNHYFLLNNSAIFNNKVTGIVGMSSNIILSRNITIVNNTGSSGGGLLLCQNAVMYLDAYTNVTITHNTANHTGGGICVDTVYLEPEPICFFQLANDPQSKQSLPETINITVDNNHAGYAGHNIFGGSIDYCYIMKSPRNRAPKSKEMFSMLFTVQNNIKYPSSVTSPPRCVYQCHNKNPSYTSRPHHILHVFPGETFTLEAVLVGQYNGIVPGTVQASLIHKSSRLGESESVQTTNLSCTLLQYTIYTSQSYEVHILKVKHTGEISGFEQSKLHNTLYINVDMMECPLGFTRSMRSDNGSIYCDCDGLFSNHRDHISCHIKQQVVRRTPPAWVGYIETDKSTRMTAYHSHCPFDYCVNTDVNLDATDNFLSQDKQCEFNRTGILCGSCATGLSNVLGSSDCQPCSNFWLLLYIPSALAGILLVLLLTLFNITVSDGTLSGIIFYCNIIENNVSIFFPDKEIIFVTKLLKIFLSLMNLEIELSMCLFNGMDGYIKAWLKFAFPLYLWFITAVFIFLSGKRRCSWIVRRNAVKVLSTLILLSYARLLTAITNALQVSYVHLNNGNYERRWMIDGNVQYFTGKHIPLFLFAFFFSLFLLPFSLCLLFIQCLQKVSHFKAFSWVNYFKPIFDAYTGPFSSSARFWTGLLLLLRDILFVVSVSDTSGDPGIIFYAIVLAVLMLLIIAWILPSSLYRRKCLSLLECSSLLNLGVLVSLLLITTKSSFISSILTHISISIAFCTFTGIIFYHISCLRPVKKLCCNIKAVQSHTGTPISTVNVEPYNEDREPLLANNN